MLFNHHNSPYYHLHFTDEEALGRVLGGDSYLGLLWGNQQSWFAWHEGFPEMQKLQSKSRMALRKKMVDHFTYRTCALTWTSPVHSSHSEAQKWDRVAVMLQQSGASPHTHPTLVQSQAELDQSKLLRDREGSPEWGMTWRLSPQHLTLFSTPKWGASSS